MFKALQIGSKNIGSKYPCFIIAEAGVNHNGKLDLALKLVDTAASAGADAIKFQTFKAEQVVTSRGKMADYQKNNIGVEKSQLDMLKDLELQEEFYTPIIKRCQDRRLIFLSTPHGGRSSVNFLEKLGVEAYKVGSGDLTNYLLLDRLAQTGKLIILSSGMATLNEIENAINFLKSRGGSKIALLHCTTNYPCPLEEVNMEVITTLRNKFNLPIGYSDHTIGLEAAIMSTTLGSSIYECHFTLDHNLPGPDHIASADPGELKARVNAIRKVELMIGQAIKTPTPSEKALKNIIRRSLVIAHDLPKGHKIKLTDLEAKRPGDGISPQYFTKFIGRTLKKAKKQDEKLKFSDILSEI